MNMMKIGTIAGALTGIGMSPKEEYQTLSKLGFDSIDYSLMYDYKDALWKLPDRELCSKL